MFNTFFNSKTNQLAARSLALVSRLFNLTNEMRKDINNMNIFQHAFSCTLKEEQSVSL